MTRSREEACLRALEARTKLEGGAAFELAPGEVSHVVETDFGFHIILRVE